MRKFLMWLLLWPILLPMRTWKLGKGGKIFAAIWVLGFIILSSSVSKSWNTSTTSRSQVVATVAQANTPQPSDTPRPSRTPLPSRTPRPSQTLEPTLAPLATIEPVITSAPEAPELSTSLLDAPTDAPEPTEPAAPTDTPQPPLRATGILAGLMPADIKVNLEQRGLECTTAEGPSQGYYVWTCKRDTSIASLHVEFYARTIITVDFIDAVVLQYGTPDDEISKQFLGYMATMPYDNAQPQNAREWVEKTLPTIKQNGDVKTTEFGAVSFSLFGLPTARTLQMGEMP